jgi:hypothetical protein
MMDLALSRASVASPLSGDAEVPVLSGATFQTNWEGLPLGSLFQRIRCDFPFDKYVGT